MRTKLSVCRRKVRYATMSEAMLAAAGGTVPLAAYRCDKCRLYHVTSRTKGKRISRDRARAS